MPSKGDLIPSCLCHLSLVWTEITRELNMLAFCVLLRVLLEKYWQNKKKKKHLQNQESSESFWTLRQHCYKHFLDRLQEHFPAVAVKHQRQKVAQIPVPY